MPTSRTGHSCVYFNHKLYIFGGRHKQKYLTELTIFDLGKN